MRSYMAGVARPIQKRALDGDSSCIVNTDGELFRLDVYPRQLALGSLSQDSISSTLASDALLEASILITKNFAPFGALRSICCP